MSSGSFFSGYQEDINRLQESELDKENIKHKLITPLLESQLNWDRIKDIVINPAIPDEDGEFVDYGIEGQYNSFYIAVEKDLEENISQMKSLMQTSTERVELFLFMSTYITIFVLVDSVATILSLTPSFGFILVFATFGIAGILVVTEIVWRISFEKSFCLDG